MKKRWLAVILALLMVMGTVGMAAAEEVDTEEKLDEQGPPAFVIEMQKMKAEQLGDDMDDDEDEDDEEGPPDFVLAMKALKIDTMSKSKLKINGNSFKSELPPVIKDGRVLIPVGAVVKGLGADEVVWNEEKRTVTITKGDVEIVLTIGDTKYTIESDEFDMDVEAQILGNRTYVPLKVIALAMGVDVEWDEKTKTVNVGKKLGHERAAEARLNSIDDEEDDEEIIKIELNEEDED